MSKGNMFLGYARGKVGSVVFSRMYGQQVTRAHNSSPNNPRTEAQARQRMLFASLSQYYKAFRYLIEQGQQGVKEGTESVRTWQRKNLTYLANSLGSVPMLPNVKGVQFPQLLPLSLTDGTLPSVDYLVSGVTNNAGDTHYAITLPFRNQYTTTEALAAMTLGDFYASYPGIQQGAQLTFVGLAWSNDYDIFDHENRAFQPLWAQYVFDPSADLTLPLFVAREGTAYYDINPAVLLSSWGERFTPEITFVVEDGVAVARFFESDFVQEGDGGIVAGSVITSYYDGNQWARSYSPFAIARGWTAFNLDAIVRTYMRAEKPASSNLYLNQAEVRTAQVGSIIENITTYVRQGEAEQTRVSSLAMAQTINVPSSTSGNGMIYIDVKSSVVPTSFETAVVSQGDPEGSGVTFPTTGPFITTEDNMTHYSVGFLLQGQESRVEVSVSWMVGSQRFVRNFKLERTSD